MHTLHYTRQHTSHGMTPYQKRLSSRTTMTAPTALRLEWHLIVCTIMLYWSPHQMLCHGNITRHSGSKQLLNAVQLLYHTCWQGTVQHEVTEYAMSLYGKVRIKPQHLWNKHMWFHTMYSCYVSYTIHGIKNSSKPNNFINVYLTKYLAFWLCFLFWTLHSLYQSAE